MPLNLEDKKALVKEVAEIAADAQSVVAHEMVAEVDVIRPGAEAAARIAQHGKVFLRLLEHAFADEARTFAAVETQQLIDQLAFRNAALV